MNVVGKPCSAFQVNMDFACWGRLVWSFKGNQHAIEF
jgi:hypothetical protein